MRDTGGLRELSALLWKERELLDVLQFKLETEQLLLENGRSRWVGRAAREVDVVLDEIGHAELARAVGVAGVAPSLGLPVDATLPDLTEALDEPWATLFRQHLLALRDSSQSILAMADRNQNLLRDARGRLEEILRAIGTAVPESP